MVVLWVQTQTLQKLSCSGSTEAAHAHKTAQYVENSRNTLPLGKEMDLEETADSESFY